MSDQLIDQYVDRASIASDTAFMKDQLKTVLELFDKVNSTKITLGGTINLKDLTAGSKDLKANMDALFQENQKLKQAFDEVAAKLENLTKAKKKAGDEDKNSAKAAADTAKAKEKLLFLYTDEAKVQAAAREEIRKRNIELKNEIAAENAVAFSLNAALTANKLLRKERGDLNLNTAEGKRRLKELNDEIDKNTQFITENNDKLTQRKINIGNYVGAAKFTTDILAKSLEDIRKEIEATNKATQAAQVSFSVPTGPASGNTRPSGGAPRAGNDDAARNLVNYGRAAKDSADKVELLAKQEIILARVVEGQSKGFASATAEAKAYEKALQAMEAAGLGNTEAFQALLKDTASLKDGIGDLKDEIKALASDTREIDLLVSSVSFVASTFQAAAGAAVAFGASEEEAAEITKDLVAIENVANGVRGVANELTTKGTAANKAYAFAQAQVKIAMDATASSAARLKAALITIGFGAILIAIGLLIANWSKLTKSTIEVDKALKGMGDTAQEIADTAIKNLDDEIDNLNDSLGKTPGNLEKAKLALKLLEAEVISSQEQLKKLREEAEKGIVVGAPKYANEDKKFILEREDTENTKKQAELRAKIRELEFLLRIQQAEEALQDIFEAERNAYKNQATLAKDAANRRLKVIAEEFEQRKITEGRFLRDSRSNLLASYRADLEAIKTNLDLQLAAAGANLTLRKRAEDDARTARILAERDFQDKLTELYRIAEQRRRKIIASTIQGLAEVVAPELSKMAQALDKITGHSTVERLEAWVAAFKEAKDSILNDIKDLEKAFGKQLLGAFEELVGFSFENQKNGIQEQIELLEEKKQKEIELANSTIANEQDKAARIANIEALAQAEREKLERQQRQVGVQKAKFEKAAALLQIAIDTIQKVAAIKAQAALLLANPLTAVLAPLALAQIPIVVGSGAVSAALIAARPIPKYRHGRTTGPAEIAYTGDGGRQEVVYSPDLSSAFITPAKDTLTYLPKGYGVAPSIEDFTDLLMSSAHKTVPVIQQQPVINENSELIRIMSRQIGRLENAILNKQETHFYWNKGEFRKAVKKGNGWTKYIQDNI